jgi:hypothetical protein
MAQAGRAPPGGGIAGKKSMLEKEGVHFVRNKVNLALSHWRGT